MDAVIVLTKLFVIVCSEIADRSITCFPEANPADMAMFLMLVEAFGAILGREIAACLVAIGDVRVGLSGD
jgi:hypothetical protein